jgi:FkbM family methyltransferase
VNKALGRIDAETMLYADKSASGLESMTRRRVQHFGIEFNYEEKIEVIQLDTWLAAERINYKPNILKMEVEGHELDILAGSTNSLDALGIV